ncbi:MAG: hypothetical protein Kow0099_21820 [Candidatus Abyssubacteria bacterium]
MEIYIFSCQHRIPDDWRPPFAPDTIGGHDVRLIQLPCSAKLSTLHLLSAIENGADGVIVLACAEKACKSLEGSRRARMRVREANAVLEEIGFGAGRIIIRQANGNAENSFRQAIEELKARIEEIGPNPLKETSKR